MPGHNGLFARQFPIAYSCLVHTDIDGFYRRRFDQFAIIQLTLQSWLRFLSTCFSYLWLAFISSPQILDRNLHHDSSLPTPCAQSCWPGRPPQHWDDGALPTPSPIDSSDRPYAWSGNPQRERHESGPVMLIVAEQGTHRNRYSLIFVGNHR
jgi:hypothetical protein